MKDLVNEKSNEVLAKACDEAPRLTFVVRRRFVLADALVRMGMFDDQMLCKRLKVNFLDESSVDLGGPSREFASLVVRQFANSKFVQGEHGKCFAHEYSIIQSQDLKKVGKLTALTILQGAPGMPIFCPPVADMIVRGYTTRDFAIEEVPHYELRKALETV